MSYLLAFLGFAALIILHEFGHFAAAKAVGMRVERFALFFPPLLFKVKRGETEYGIGAIPLGGYVRITGMNPNEEIPPELEHRAYYRQPVWKRVVVISAGPLMNVLVAFVILVGLFWSQGEAKPTTRVAKQSLSQPAASVLKPGDSIVAVDGKRVTGPLDVRDALARHPCAGSPRKGCEAATPALVTVQRGSRRLTFHVRPRYDAQYKRMRLGFAFEIARRSVGPAEAAKLSVQGMWRVSKATVSALARIFDAKQRKQISGVVGTSETLRQTIQFSWVDALNVLAIISLSLAIVNLFPFLPLDGGHIFWAVVEKIRRKPVPYSTMERSGIIGFALVLMLFAIGLTNDIGQLSNGGFKPR
jgi:regulator of sigma E protease